MKRAIKHALVTEKSATIQANNNQYVFVVESGANKLEIKKEVEALKNGIEVISIRTINVRGKVKRMGRSIGKRSNWKKALVRLKAGQTLELFDSAV
jgi:large subunit ribosomal protein L23